MAVLETVRTLNSGDCAHCKGTVLYECDRFKAEMTKRGLVFELYGGCSQMEAADTYQAWLKERDKKGDQYVKNNTNGRP